MEPGALDRKGAKALDGEPTAKGGESFDPLQIFAEGDSWFDYPVPFFGGGIIPRLEDRLGVPILNLAKAGDEVRYMLGVEERATLTEHLTDGSPAGGPWDVLLFSGGGNDIVDNPMALWVKDWNPAMPPAAHIHKARFDAALALVRAGYEDLIELRNELSPKHAPGLSRLRLRNSRWSRDLRLRSVARAHVQATKISDACRDGGSRQGHA